MAVRKDASRKGRVLFLLAATSLVGQTPIRVSTHLVEVSVIVRSASGAVAELQQEDFRLFDNGKEQKIAFFQQDSRRAAATSAPLPPGIYTNSPPDVSTVVLLDGLNTPIRDQGYARQQFLRFLKQIRPTDRVAVYTLGSGLSHLATDSDPDPEVDQWLNEANAVLAEQSIKDRVGRTVAALQAIARHLARAPGRKNLVWITGSFPFTIGQKGLGETIEWNDVINPPAQKRRGRLAPTQRGAEDEDAGGAYETYGKDLPGSKPGRELFVGFDQEVRRATRALNDAGVAVYPVDARGVVADPRHRLAPTAPQMGIQSMQVMADSTGGRAFYNTNDLYGAIRSAVDDAEVTYTLAFYPAALDGRFHDLKVQANRKGLEIRHRKSYFASAEEPPAETDIRNALASPLDATAISVAARRDGNVLTLSIEPNDLALTDGKADLEIATSLPSRQRVKVAPVFSIPFAPGPGTKRVRVVIADRKSGRIGSLTLDIR